MPCSCEPVGIGFVSSSSYKPFACRLSRVAAFCARKNLYPTRCSSHCLRTHSLFMRSLEIAAYPSIKRMQRRPSGAANLLQNVHNQAEDTAIENHS